MWGNLWSSFTTLWPHSLGLVTHCSCLIWAAVPSLPPAPRVHGHPMQPAVRQVFPKCHLLHLLPKAHWQGPQSGLSKSSPSFLPPQATAPQDTRLGEEPSTHSVVPWPGVPRCRAGVRVRCFLTPKAVLPPGPTAGPGPPSGHCSASPDGGTSVLFPLSEISLHLQPEPNPQSSWGFMRPGHLLSPVGQKLFRHVLCVSHSTGIRLRTEETCSCAWEQLSSHIQTPSTPLAVWASGSAHTITLGQEGRGVPFLHEYSGFSYV